MHGRPMTRSQARRIVISSDAGPWTQGAGPRAQLCGSRVRPNCLCDQGSRVRGGSVVSPGGWTRTDTSRRLTTQFTAHHPRQPDPRSSRTHPHHPLQTLLLPDTNRAHGPPHSLQPPSLGLALWAHTPVSRQVKPLTFIEMTGMLGVKLPQSHSLL